MCLCVCVCVIIYYYNRNQNTTSSLDSVGSESPSGPLKARKKLRTRKSSQENLLDDSPSNGVVVRPATSAEDLHLITSDRSPKVRGQTIINIIIITIILNYSSLQELTDSVKHKLLIL